MSSILIPVYTVGELRKRLEGIADQTPLVLSERLADRVDCEDVYLTVHFAGRPENAHEVSLGPDPDFTFGRT